MRQGREVKGGMGSVLEGGRGRARGEAADTGMGGERGATRK